MHASTLRALEFDLIAAVVRSYAVTPLGSRRLDRLTPSTEPVRVAEGLDLTGEAILLLQDHQSLPLRAGEAVSAALDGLALLGCPLEPLRLLALADFFDSVDRTAALVERAATRLPALAVVARRTSRFTDENARVRKAISQHGDVVDDASPALAGLRDKLRRQRQRLRGTLESYLRGRDTAKYLQDQVITERNGRYVIVVRAEHRGAIPGLIHGASASGASLYLEPLSTVEVNNDIVALEEQEAEEVRRILLALTDGYRVRAGDLQATLEAATELDVIQARARFSMSFNGVRPALSHDGRLELRHARHPLLIPAVARRLPQDGSAGLTQEGSAGLSQPGVPQGRIARESEPVASDLLVIPPARALVITGPNTGGKTVALKTAGLLVLMAQAGLFVPAEAGSRLPVFRSVFADIGDEQSIAANLSTFSWHITSIVSMEQALKLPALVLLDEVGNGTDPVEGGALGRGHHRPLPPARRRGRGHDALRDDQVVRDQHGRRHVRGLRLRAGDICPDLSPHLRVARRQPGIRDRGTAGSASRRARRGARLAERQRGPTFGADGQAGSRAAVAGPRATTHGAGAGPGRGGRAAVARARRGPARARGPVHPQARTAPERAVARCAGRGGQGRRRPAPAGRRAREAAAEAHRRHPDRRDGRPPRVVARAALDAIAERVRDGSSPGVAHRACPPNLRAPAKAGAAKVGDRVEVGVLRLQGVVRALTDKDAEVDVNGKRMRVRVTELRKVGGATQQASPSVRVTLAGRAETPGAGVDLNVIGCTVDEAIDRADKFLDQAAMQELRTVRVIHGHGTGRLRQALSGYLNAHPLVLRAAPAPNDKGGGAVTLVELRD